MAISRIPDYAWGLVPIASTQASLTRSADFAPILNGTVRPFCVPTIPQLIAELDVEKCAS